MKLTEKNIAFWYFYFKTAYSRCMWYFFLALLKNKENIKPHIAIYVVFLYT